MPFGVNIQSPKVPKRNSPFGHQNKKKIISIILTELFFDKHIAIIVSKQNLQAPARKRDRRKELATLNGVNSLNVKQGKMARGSELLCVFIPLPFNPSPQKRKQGRRGKKLFLIFQPLDRRLAR